MNVMAPGIATEAAEPQPFKLRIEDYELLDRAGVFKGQRVELIGGLLVEMSPQQRPHSYTKNELTYRLRLALEALGSSLSAQSEVTVALRAHHAPEPDIALTSAPRGKGYVPSETIALLVEVADTTLGFDLGDKKQIYAAAGIPEYWVVDVNERELHQFWSPSAAQYTGTLIVPLDGPITSATIPDLAIDGSGIL